MTATILIVEDDENLRLALVDNLEDEGYGVRAAPTVALAERALAADDVHLILLDIMLPDGDGYAVCRRLRERGVGVPILMLTARTLEDDLVRGFDAGADDYLTKPYRLRELLVRVRALLRRSAVSGGPAGAGEPGEARLCFGPFSLDLEARSLAGPGGGAVELTRTEFDLLAFFLRNDGRALTRDEILDAVWGTDVVVDGRTVDNFVSSLKKKLGWDESATYAIRTIRGVGYRMESELG